MVQVLIKAFDILELVALRKGQPISLTEISEESQINQATAANIINTLVTKNYLEHIGKKKGYKLGLAAYQLTNEVAYKKELAEAAKQPMAELTALLNESCLLGILQNYKRYILHVEHSNQDIQVQIRSERNVYETASGRLLLAYLSPKELEQFIKQNGLPDSSIWEGVSTYEELTEILKTIKYNGYTLTHLRKGHVKGLAVPIFKNEKVIAGLSVFLPEYRCPISKEMNIIDSMLNTSASISRNLNSNSSL